MDTEQMREKLERAIYETYRESHNKMFPSHPVPNFNKLRMGCGLEVALAQADAAISAYKNMADALTGDGEQLIVSSRTKGLPSAAILSNKK